jgi:hypothetical protein
VFDVWVRVRCRIGRPSRPLERFEAAQAEVAALAFDALTAPEVLTVKDRLETVSRR